MTLTDVLRDAVSLRDAAALFPRRPHVATVFRWSTAGVRGVVLKTYVAGGRRVTTTAAVEEFLRAINDAPAPAAPRQGGLTAAAKLQASGA